MKLVFSIFNASFFVSSNFLIHFSSLFTTFCSCCRFSDSKYMLVSSAERKQYNFTKRKLHTLVKCYCKNLEIKVVFSSFKITNLMNVKDLVPRSLRSSVIYKFTCAECNSVSVRERSRHLFTHMC